MLDIYRTGAIEPVEGNRPRRRFSVKLWLGLHLCYFGWHSDEPLCSYKSQEGTTTIHKCSRCDRLFAQLCDAENRHYTTLSLEHVLAVDCLYRHQERVKILKDYFEHRLNDETY